MDLHWTHEWIMSRLVDDGSVFSMICYRMTSGASSVNNIVSLYRLRHLRMTVLSRPMCSEMRWMDHPASVDNETIFHLKSTVPFDQRLPVVEPVVDYAFFCKPFLNHGLGYFFYRQRRHAPDKTLLTLLSSSDMLIIQPFHRNRPLIDFTPWCSMNNNETWLKNLFWYAKHCF